MIILYDSIKEQTKFKPKKLTLVDGGHWIPISDPKYRSGTPSTQLSVLRGAISPGSSFHSHFWIIFVILNQRWEMVLWHRIFLSEHRFWNKTEQIRGEDCKFYDNEISGFSTTPSCLVSVLSRFRLQEIRRRWRKFLWKPFILVFKL